MGTTSYSKSGSAPLLNTDSLGQLGRQVRVLAAAATALSETVAENQRDQTRDFFNRLGLPMPSLARARSCKTPDCGCDQGTSTKGLGVLRQVLDRPETAHFTVKMRNNDCEKRSYSLTAAQNPEAHSLILSPADLVLDPGQSTEVRIELDASKTPYGSTIRDTVRVSGENCAPQFLEVEVSVQRPVEVVPTITLTCCCDTGMKPQKWYHHYYCDPPRKQRDTAPEVAQPPAPPAIPVAGPN